MCHHSSLVCNYVLELRRDSAFILYRFCGKFAYLGGCCFFVIGHLLLGNSHRSSFICRFVWLMIRMFCLRGAFMPSLFRKLLHQYHRPNVFVSSLILSTVRGSQIYLANFCKMCSLCSLVSVWTHHLRFFFSSALAFSGEQIICELRKVTFVVFTYSYLW